ncbi:hypothetical protein HF086_016476 [Spodoptera exigua]|uniref:Uncharacterized protein n=1 Tax=Spodoptera exigua TaxID=7107 RepID=A0A922MWH5_SPOEX|nr:hypothetical protein HF086_016476 [Spodoptera exigua]
MRLVQPKQITVIIKESSDKPDLGLEELSQLDVKSKFEVFERKAKQPEEPLPQEPRVPREKTAAILSKLAKFKAKGMDVGVSDEYLNGVPVEQSSSEPEEDEEGIGKKSRSIFLELDANAKNMPPTSPPPGEVPKRKEIAQQLARTKSFRDRFENWSESEPQRSPSTVVIERQPENDEDGESQLETAKSLRQKFESMNVTQSNVTKTFVPKVNRFV